jgi:ribosomal-protein-alanine N-acetyltransferase
MGGQVANTPALETGRLLLRKFTENDIDSLMAIYGDDEVNTYLPWFPVKSREEARAFFEENYAKAYREEKGYRYAICLKPEDHPIGYVHMSMDDSYDLGYGLRKEFWHRGIVTEACKAVIDQIRRDGIPYITATHDIRNARSGQVMKRLGMRYQYSYEEQWKPKDYLVTFRLYQLNFSQREDWVYRKYWNKYPVHFVESDV